MGLRRCLTLLDDHLDSSHSSRSRLGAVCLLTGDPAFLQELQHDVHMAARPGQLLGEVLQHHLHQFVLLLGHSVDRNVTEENRVGADPQVVLDFAQDELTARPAVLQNALEPGMLRHRHFLSVAPQFGYKFVGRHGCPSSVLAAYHRKVCVDSGWQQEWSPGRGLSYSSHQCPR